MPNQLERINDIQQKIENLKAEQLKIEQAVTSDILEFLKKHNAFRLDQDELLGGLLYVINNIQAGSKEVEGWRQAGEKFQIFKAKSSKAIKKKELA